MAQNRVLIVDDEASIVRSLTLLLNKEQMITDSASTGSQALELIEQKEFDLILLDVDLPDIDGFKIISMIRAKQIMTPVLFLSGKDEEYNQIQGMTLGADGYISKPFSPGYLIMRIKTLIRRNTEYVQTNSTKNIGPFTIDDKNYQIFKDDQLINLTGKEIVMLKFFLEHPNQVFTKDQVYNQVWQNDVVDDNTIAVYIKRIREKIESNPSEPQFLQTVWGIGYKFVV